MKNKIILTRVCSLVLVSFIGIVSMCASVFLGSSFNMSSDIVCDILYDNRALIYDSEYQHAFGDMGVLSRLPSVNSDGGKYSNSYIVLANITDGALKKHIIVSYEDNVVFKCEHGSRYDYSRVWTHSYMLENFVDASYSEDNGATWYDCTKNPTWYILDGLDGTETEVWSFSRSNYRVIGGKGSVYCECGRYIGELGYSSFTFDGQGGDVPPVSDDIGYLKNLSHQITYKRGYYYNYNEESRVDRWTYDLESTTGSDLSSGKYSIKHYVRPVVVNGYGDSDVIEKLDKYYDDTYDASLGYVQYLDKDLDDKLAEQGFDGLGWFDKYIRGYFILRWHYFEIIDNETGQSGGYVCLKPKDADESNFGTEFEVIAVDENDNVDESYEKDVAYTGEGSYVTSEGETIEDAFEKAESDAVEQEEHSNIVNLDGLEVFSSVMGSFADSTSDFSSVILGFFNCLPSWVLTIFGLSVALTFLLFIIKNLR